ncbi:MAG: hypothetical protein IPO00_07630 [Betaproteobacteria bacterium]|nr:hypothetical protein [Betaproteobacteria bacterium]
MTNPQPPSRELADPALSRLYRDAAADVPSPSLDAAILAAARAAVAPRAAAKKPWWQRLSLPVSIAATVLMTVTLSLTMQHNPPDVADIAAPRPSPASPAEKAKAEPAEPPAAAKAMREAPVPVVQPPAAPVPHTERKARSAASVPQARDTSSSPAQESRVVAPSPAALPAVKEGKGEMFENAKKLESLESGASADRAVPARGRAAKEAAAAPAALVPPAGAVAPQAQRETAWLEEIRALRRQGQHEAAARRLIEFRSAYPDYPLPDDLK